MLAILAPVPSEILADGFEVKNPEGLIAFGAGWQEWKSSGAGAFDFFNNTELTNGRGSMPVLIYGSRRSDQPTKPHNLHRPGFATAIAIYEGWRPALITGKHPRPDFRPKSALAGDTPCALFWEVSGLQPLAPKDQIPLNQLKIRLSGKLKSYSGRAPRDAQLIIVPDQLVVTEATA